MIYFVLFMTRDQSIKNAFHNSYPLIICIVPYPQLVRNLEFIIQYWYILDLLI